MVSLKQRYVGGVDSTNDMHMVSEIIKYFMSHFVCDKPGCFMSSPTILVGSATDAFGHFSMLSVVSESGDVLCHQKCIRSLMFYQTVIVQRVHEACEHFIHLCRQVIAQCRWGHPI